MTGFSKSAKVLHQHSCGKNNDMFCHHQRVIIDSGDCVVAHKKISSPEASELTESVHVIGCNRSVLAEISSIVVFFHAVRFFFYVALSQVYACCI